MEGKSDALLSYVFDHFNIKMNYYLGYHDIMNDIDQYLISITQKINDYTLHIDIHTNYTNNNLYTIDISLSPNQLCLS